MAHIDLGTDHIEEATKHIGIALDELQKFLDTKVTIESEALAAFVARSVTTVSALAETISRHLEDASACCEALRVILGDIDVFATKLGLNQGD